MKCSLGSRALRQAPSTARPMNARMPCATSAIAIIRADKLPAPRLSSACRTPPSERDVTFRGVDPVGMSKARIALASFFSHTDTGAYVLNYRINGGAFHDRGFTGAELAHTLSAAESNGVQAQMLDVPFSEIVAGDNTLEFVSTEAAQTNGYPPAVANIDLILSP